MALSIPLTTNKMNWRIKWILGCLWMKMKGKNAVWKSSMLILTQTLEKGKYIVK